MKKFGVTLLIAVTIAIAGACSSTEKSSTSSTKKDGEVPLHTMYAVGDIDHFDALLKPLAVKIIREDPNASWWILGDAGYGNGNEVTKAYEKLADVIPETSLHMIFGDHDYGTQDPDKFTKENLLETGAGTILNAEETPSYFVDATGNVVRAAETQEDVSWAITGTNDICVEVESLENSDCHEEQFTDFNDALTQAKSETTCSIAMWHHPIYGTLKGGGQDQKGSKKYGVPLFTASFDNGVDIVLNGDHHHFLATKEIDKNGKPVTKSGDAHTREFIIGTGGAPLSSDQGTPKLLFKAIDADIRNQVGVVKIDLYPNKAKLYFITESGIAYSTKISC